MPFGSESGFSGFSGAKYQNLACQGSVVQNQAGQGPLVQNLVD